MKEKKKKNRVATLITIDPDIKDRATKKANKSVPKKSFSRLVENLLYDYNTRP